MFLKAATLPLSDDERDVRNYMQNLEDTIADIRDRLRLFSDRVCGACGCAPRESREDFPGRCGDCDHIDSLVGWNLLRSRPYVGHTAAACVSVGLRALCGRRILEGC